MLTIAFDLPGGFSNRLMPAFVRANNVTAESVSFANIQLRMIHFNNNMILEFPFT